MKNKGDWEVEVTEDITHVRIDSTNYFIDSEEACIVHALLLLSDELTTIAECINNLSSPYDASR